MLSLPANITQYFAPRLVIQFPFVEAAIAPIYSMSECRAWNFGNSIAEFASKRQRLAVTLGKFKIAPLLIGGSVLG